MLPNGDSCPVQVVTLSLPAKTVAKLAGWIPVSMSYWLEMMPEARPCSPGIGQVDEAHRRRQLADAGLDAPPGVGPVEHLLLGGGEDDPPGRGRHRPALRDDRSG